MGSISKLCEMCGFLVGKSSWIEYACSLTDMHSPDSWMLAHRNAPRIPPPKGSFCQNRQLDRCYQPLSVKELQWLVGNPFVAAFLITMAKPTPASTPIVPIRVNICSEEVNMNRSKQNRHELKQNKMWSMLRKEMRHVVSEVGVHETYNYTP